MKKITHHLIANSKGGCGKSTTAFLLASYKKSNNSPTVNMDYDTLCGSFSLFKSLNISPIISKEKGAEKKNFESWVNALKNSEHDTITDFSVSDFEAGTTQLLETKILESLKEQHGHHFMLHVPLALGASMYACTQGFERYHAIYGNSFSYVCWLHKFLLPRQDEDFYQSKFYSKNKDKIQTIIDLPMHTSLELEAMREMLKVNMTFDDILSHLMHNNGSLAMMQRYKILRDKYHSLGSLFEDINKLQ